MRSHLFGKSDYFLRIKRKPAQELLYQRVVAGELTDDDIESCGQPLWVREALHEIKARGGKTQWQTVDAVIAATEAAQAEAAKQLYPVYQWILPMEEIIPSKGMSVEIETGDFILIDRLRGQMKVDYSLLTLEPAKMESIAMRSEFKRLATDPDFVAMVGLRKQHS